MSMLEQLRQLVHSLPPQLRGLSLEHLIKFIDGCKAYSEDATAIGDGHDMPVLPPLPNVSPLPPHVLAFLSSHVQLDQESVRTLWAALSPILLQGSTPASADQATHLEPPTTTCPRAECQHNRLVDARTYTATFFTLQRGAMPASVSSLYCKRCKTRYHPDFYVWAASNPGAMRVYYEGLPAVIGVTEHYFFEPQLCVFIENMYLFSHASSEGVARVYNRCMAQNSHVQHSLHGEVVFEAFLLHALLRHKATLDEVLAVPHSGSRADRLNTALHDRNVRMAGTGQPQWAHACKGCMLVKHDARGRPYRQTACVIDGVTLQHPCCGYQSEKGMPCRNALSSTRDRFCPEHAEERTTCAVKGCRLPADLGFSTCSLSEHRTMETSRAKAGKSMFQLKERLQISSQFLTTGRREKRTTRDKAKRGSKKKHTLTRTWTHNEELAVRCCGVIISRATFFQAEATTGVKDFVMATFPEEFPGSKPSFLFYDDNCTLHKFVASLDPRSKIRAFFARIGLPVDVFHFESKHKETDLVCQTHCNPASFPDLMKPDGTWAFNSSAAEQANRWIKKYKGIVREMSAVHFNFFLDEMISLRNEFIVENLNKKGLIPHIVPDEELLHNEHVE